MLQEVINHINRFPRVESHYCRKDTKREYLDPKLSIAKMYELYKTHCEESKIPHVSHITYRRIFSTHHPL